MSIKEKFKNGITKVKEKAKDFEEKHPEEVDAARQVGIFLCLWGSLVIPFMLGRASVVIEESEEEHQRKLAEEAKKIAKEQHNEWLRKEQEIYKENWDNEKYNNNFELVKQFASTLPLNPGESFYIIDNNQYIAEGLPVDMGVYHEVYGIDDPNNDAYI